MKGRVLHGTNDDGSAATGGDCSMQGRRGWVGGGAGAQRQRSAGPALGRYRSKISPALVAFLALLTPALVGPLWDAWEKGRAAEIAFLTPIVGVILVALGSLSNTRYWIEGSILHVRCSVFRWRIPVDSIIRITPADGMSKGPKLGFHGIEVWYRRGSLVISPRRESEFLADLERARGVGEKMWGGVRA